MTRTPEENARLRAEAIERQDVDRCYECGGGFRLPSGVVPHADDCSRAG